jgi:two-component system nitrate/nitrite sensor histidine kinase NarX
MKHASAEQAWVIVDAQPQFARLTIRDDGQGFDPVEPQPGHLGVGIMQERAQRIGAEIVIESQPAQGTKITLSWDLEKSSHS